MCQSDSMEIGNMAERKSMSPPGGQLHNLTPKCYFNINRQMAERLVVLGILAGIS